MYEKDIEELEKLINIALRPNIKRQLSEYKNNLSNLLKEEQKKIESDKKKAEQTQKDKPEENKDKSPSEIDQAKLNAQFTTISKYAFDTSKKSKFTKTSFDVCVLNWKGRNYRFSCFNLSKEINPTDSYVKQTNSGLIVYLAKANTSDFWDSLEKKKGLFGNKDEDSPALDKNKDPNQSLMEMMRDMYQNGDPEMKRMIAEAWTKSRDEQEAKNKHDHDHHHDHDHDHHH